VLLPDPSGPFALLALLRIQGHHEESDFTDLARAMRSRSSRGGSIGTFIDQASAVGWRLSEVVGGGSDQALVNARRLLDADHPLLLFAYAGFCHGSNPAMESHVTLVTGYDDALGALLITDVNWSVGVRQVAYSELRQGNHMLLLAQHNDSPLETPLRALIAATPVTAAPESAASWRDAPICLD
jgi:hypothetical protein